MRPRPSTILRASCALGLALACASASASAQDAPLIDAVGAYHHANVMAQPRTGDAKPATGKATGSQPDRTISRARFDAIVADLRVQYRVRADRDGQADADRWLRQEVAALRQRYTTIED